MMYALSPIVTLPALPPCTRPMYEMRNIHADEQRCGRCPDDDADTDAKMPDGVVTEQKPSPEYTALEIRQEKILNQLAELKKQVSTLCVFLKQSNQHVVKKDCAPKKAININLLIKASTKHIPFFLHALQKLWKDTDFRIKTYTHSTVKEEVHFDFLPSMVSTVKNIVNITLIWKEEVPHMETYTDLHSEPILGQANLLRYLYRMIDPYETDIMHTNLMDRVLDMCHVSSCLQLFNRDVLYELSATVDEWSGRDKPNIADVCLWSLINQNTITLLPKPLEAWRKTCERTFLSDDCEKIIIGTCYDT